MAVVLGLINLFLCSFLWRLGGKERKYYRRYGIPLALTVAGLLDGFSIWKLLAGVILGLILRLPFTLKGDSIDAHDLNWFWVFIWAGLISMPAFLHAFNGWVFASWIVSTAVISLFAYLSNFEETRDVVRWNTCERVFGFFCAFPFLTAILS